MTPAQETLMQYVASRKPLLYVYEGRINYVCNLVVIDNYAFGDGSKAEGIAIGLDKWYMPTNYGVRAVRFLQGKLEGTSDDIWDIGENEIRRTLPEFGEDLETNRWNAECKKNISKSFFKTLQNTLLDDVVADYGLKKRRG
jgi:hypothetical protein